MQQVIDKLEQQGVVFVPVSMPGLAEINGRVGFPVALYEAYDDMQSYLKRYQPQTTVEAMAAQIGSADVKGTYAALVIPRLLPGPGNALVPARPIYQAAMAQARPQLQALYASTFADNHIDALLFPTTPHVAPPAGPESSSLANFGLYIQNTDPGSDAGIPGLSIPAGIGASGLPVGVEIDGPSESDRRLIAVGEAIEMALGPLPAPRN
jgi:Asp-tRNA(Asn)/Glu-tRNA(Gln) amidotransferase A subunit family amidase